MIHATYPIHTIVLATGCRAAGEIARPNRGRKVITEENQGLAVEAEDLREDVLGIQHDARYSMRHTPATPTATGPPVAIIRGRRIACDECKVLGYLRIGARGR